MKSYNMTLISNQRHGIMGFAALWIALFHTPPGPLPSFLSPLENFFQIGNIGVDVFLLISGISLYYSFHANRNIPGFYLRRAKRILLPTLTLLVPVTLYRWLFRDTVTGILDFILECTGFSLFTNGNLKVWFISAILLMYFLYPVFFGIFSRTKWSKWTLFGMLAACLLTNLGLRLLTPVFWNNAHIFFRRIPVFLTGVYLGKAVYDRKELPLRPWQIAALALLLCALCVFWKQRELWAAYIHVYYLFAVSAVPVTMLLSILVQWKPLGQITEFYGKISLEFYLSHAICLSALTKLLKQREGMLLYALAFISATILAKLLSMVCGRLLKTGAAAPTA